MERLWHLWMLKRHRSCINFNTLSLQHYPPRRPCHSEKITWSQNLMENESCVYLHLCSIKAVWHSYGVPILSAFAAKFRLHLRGFFPPSVWDFLKDFILFSYALHCRIIVVLLWRGQRVWMDLFRNTWVLPNTILTSYTREIRITQKPQTDKWFLKMSNLTTVPDRGQQMSSSHHVEFSLTLYFPLVE